MFSGAFRERLHNSWVEMRENPARSALQALGVILGVASVLGGFSISDSQRRRADQLYVRLGGLDKLNVQPNPAVNDGPPPPSRRRTSVCATRTRPTEPAST